jgi:hypothetical protein
VLNGTSDQREQHRREACERQAANTASGQETNVAARDGAQVANAPQQLAGKQRG